MWRYPVKSMAGEQLRSARVDWRGMGGDRTHAVMFESKTGRRPLTAREAPALLAFKASYPFAPDAGLDPADPPAAQVTTPDGGRIGWPDAARLRRRVQDETGYEVELERDLDGIQDLGKSLLITTEASRRALEEELGVAVDLRRFRPNVHLELDAPAWAEQQWEGGRIAFEGGVILRLLHPCERCAIPNRDPDTQEKWPELLRHLAKEHGNLFGINARVVVAGRIAVRQSVQVS
jgi:uncharacterized protein